MSPLILHGNYGCEGKAKDSSAEPRNWNDEVSKRWELARQKLAELDLKSVPTEHPLRVLIERDVPRLMKESEGSRSEAA